MLYNLFTTVLSYRVIKDFNSSIHRCKDSRILITSKWSGAVSIPSVHQPVHDFIIHASALVQLIFDCTKWFEFVQSEHGAVGNLLRSPAWDKVLCMRSANQYLPTYSLLTLRTGWPLFSELSEADHTPSTWFPCPFIWRYSRRNDVDRFHWSKSPWDSAMRNSRFHMHLPGGLWDHRVKRLRTTTITPRCHLLPPT